MDDQQRQDDLHSSIHSSVHATHPLVGTELTFGSVTDKISEIVLKRKTPITWFIGFAVSFALFQLMMLAITKLVFIGIGEWGVNVPVAWGGVILNFVWWIGIGHAGTLISAILLLLRQKWRTSINRFAEAMTLFAVAQARSEERRVGKECRSRWSQYH